MSEQDSTPRTTDGDPELLEKSLTGSAYTFVDKVDASDKTTEELMAADNDE